MDQQIAATVLRHGGTVVTRNVRDFKVIPGLTVEDWSNSAYVRRFDMHHLV